MPHQSKSRDNYSFLIVITMRLSALIIVVGSLFATAVCSSPPYTCTELVRGHLFVSPNKRRQSSHHNIEHRAVFVNKKGNLLVSTRRECHLHKPSSCKHPYFTFEMCQGSDEAENAGCECPTISLGEKSK